MGTKGPRRGTALAAIVLSLAVMGAGQPALDALEVDMSAPDIERALRLARWPASDADRARFHGRYVFRIDGPVIGNLQLESIEIVTEFRRTELMAEEHVRINDMFGRAGLSEVTKALEPWRGLVFVVARVRLMSAGRLVGLPPIDVALDSVPVRGDVRRTNISNDEVLAGGLIETPFDAQSVGQMTRSVVVRWNGRTLGGARVDFRALD